MGQFVDAGVADIVVSTKTLSASNKATDVVAANGSLKATVCKGINPCEILHELPAGTDLQGKPLYVVEVQAPEDALIVWLMSLQGNDWHLVQKLWKTRWSEDLEAEGYSQLSRMVEISTSTIILRQHEGSMMQSGDTRTIHYPPLRILSDDFWTGGTGQDHTRWRWNWSMFSGYCEFEYRTDDPHNRMSGGNTTAHGVIVPLVAVSTFTWREIPLGDCSAIIDFRNAFRLAGTLEPSNDPYFRVLQTSPHDFIINLPNRTWTSGSPSWLNDDHLEIWLESGEDMEEEAWQWGIRLADGKLFRAYGQWKSKVKIMTEPIIEITDITQKSKSIKAIHIRTPIMAQPNRFGFSLSLGNGASNVRMLASTAEIKYGYPGSFGSDWQVDPRIAQCHVENGQLTVIPGNGFNPNESLLSNPPEFPEMGWEGKE